MRAARDPRFPQLREFHRELADAELAGEISEFYALGLQAIIAMANDAEFATDYLDMAESIADSGPERNLLAQWRSIYEQLQSDSCHSATQRRPSAPRRDLDGPDDDELIALRGSLLDMFRQLGVLDPIPTNNCRRSHAA
jgi:hypothetical protein